MEAGYAGERVDTRAERRATQRPSVVVPSDADLQHEVSGGLDSVKQRVDDDCAGGIVRFSLGSRGH